MGKWNDGWEKVIKNIKFDKREPMWEQAIEHLISEGVMVPTMSMELSQEHIQEIILEGSASGILDLFEDFGRWIGTKSFLYVQQPLASSSGNAFWLAYLMATQYAMEWDGENWVGIVPPSPVVEMEAENE